MKATGQIKQVAYGRATDYFLNDPDRSGTRITNPPDQVAPDGLLPGPCTAHHHAIGRQNNWHQLIMNVSNPNPAARDDLIKTLLIDGNLLGWPERKTRVQSDQHRRRPTLQCSPRIKEMAK